MGNNIRISKKHGLNPTLLTCFWCGEETGEIALLGKIDKEDSAAPMRCVLNYEPCEKCKKLFSQGIHVIGCTEERPSNGLPPISRTGDADMYPTGAYVVVSRDYIKRVFAQQGNSFVDRVLKCGKLLAEDVVVKEIIASSQQVEQVNA
jgi:hypothetical protein